MANLPTTPKIPPMPPAAMLAALDTFARVTHERHPGVVLVPLGDIGSNGAIVAAAAGEVVRPFAAPPDRDSLLDRDAGVAALDDHRVDRAAEDALAILDR
jgi:hypothetical protein